MATPRLLERYRTEVVPALEKEFGYANIMQVPRIVKVVLNIGMGEALQNAKALDAAVTCRPSPARNRSSRRRRSR